MIWQHLGFSKNIFFIEPLMPIEDEIGLFAGRENDIKKFIFDVFNDTRALKIVSGELGVGKTTFVNACQYYSYSQNYPIKMDFPTPRLLPCYEKIQVRDADTLDDIVQKAIVAVSRSIVIHCDNVGIKAPKKAKEILSYFLDLTISTGGASIGGSFTVLGTGGGVSGATGTSSANVLRDAKYYLNELSQIVRDQLELDGLFILINNLDILSNKKLVMFLNEARDEIFDIDHIYWILIGRKGIGSIIASESDRVTDYLSGTESYLAPLDFDTLKRIIHLRSERHSISKDSKIPLSDKIIRTFHYLSLKETRETLKICGEITKRVIQIDPSIKIIPDEIALQAFVRYAYDCTKDLDLNEPQQNVLKAVYAKRSCRPKDFAQYGYGSSQGFIGALKGLVHKRLLTVEERGRARIYKLTGMTVLSAITGALGTDIQKEAEDTLTRDFREGHMPGADNFFDAQLSLDFEEDTEV